MVVLRVIGGLLPQILILLIFSVQQGLFGGWNNVTLEFVGLLAMLILFGPIVTVILLIVETVRYRKIKREQG